MPAQSLVVFSAIFFTALIMRGPITVVGPIAEQLQAALGMDYQTYGVLAALPVLCFGIFTVATTVITKAMRIQYALAAISALILMGCSLRLVALQWLFMFATVVVAAGIAMLNTLMPVFVRQYVPIHPDKSIAILTALIGLSSCLGTYSSVPLFTYAQSYLFPLALWCIVAAIAFCFWCLSAHQKIQFTQSNSQVQWNILKRWPTWSVIGTMGFQSLAMYTVAAWLPTLLISQGFCLQQAGICTSIFVLFTVPASFLTAWLIHRCQGEKILSIVVTIIFCISIALWMVGGFWVYLASALAGFSQGVRFSLAIILISKKSNDTHEMMMLSTVAQGMGYLIGASGPFICGHLYQANGDWGTVYTFFFIATILWGIAAYDGFGKGKVFHH